MSNNDLHTHLTDPGRLAALRAVALLDTPVEKSFDRLTRLAVRVIGAPVALVSLVDANRQFFKSCIGLPEPWNTSRETPLSYSFCQHNRISGKPLIIEDARLDPLFRNNLAVHHLRVVAYLGIPLVTPDGYVLGSFCVIDSSPRAWTKEEEETVNDLAAAVMTEILLRTEIAARARAEKERERGIVDLQEALKQVQALQRILPRCGRCGKIRGEDGRWRPLEDLLQESHPAGGNPPVCPGCAADQNRKGGPFMARPVS